MTDKVLGEQDCYCGRPIVRGELITTLVMCGECRHIDYLCDCPSRASKTTLCTCGHAKSDHVRHKFDRTGQGFGFGDGGGQGARPTICGKCPSMNADHGFMSMEQQKAFMASLGISSV